MNIGRQPVFFLISVRFSFHLLTYSLCRFLIFFGQDKYIQQIEQKASDLTGYPVTNIEPLQMVCYRKNQFYNEHHDAGSLMDDGSVDVVPPARIITIFVYLNTMPEEEGYTEFPNLGITIRPEKCSAIMFCNFLPNGFLSVTQNLAYIIHSLFCTRIYNRRG